MQDREGLPSTAEVGDLFVIHDTGAHSHSMGFQYNGKLRAPELLIRCSEESGSTASSPSTTSSCSGPGYNGPLDKRAVHLIREREDVHCLFDNTVMPQDLMPSPAVLPAAYPYAGRLGKPKGAPTLPFPPTLGLAALVGAISLTAAYGLHLVMKGASRAK